MNRILLTCALAILWWVTACAHARAASVDERPAGPGEWGFRPSAGSSSELDPPAFCWRPQKGAVAYEIEINGPSKKVSHAGIIYTVFCPPTALGPGEFSWRFRFTGASGEKSEWSSPVRFTIANGARLFPLPARDELMARIPSGHPRLFMRPESIGRVREAAAGHRKPEFDAIVAACDKLLVSPPDSSEPPTYPKGVKAKSEEWKSIWWGNRVRTIKVLESAAMLAFAGMIAGRDDFRALAKRLLLDATKWDPHGSTGYVYNDEAGMPYAYHFSRAYSFLHDSLDEAQRDACRKVMAQRGREMYRRLCPRHFWWPFDSHANRAWHFLGEVGIAFLGEIDDAAEWVWFAANVFRCVYPVWSDDQGGWHEGVSYWRSYIGRFAWWAAVMKEALGLDAYALPYFSQVGYYPMYLQPPGHRDGGFGDLCENKDSKGNALLMRIFAAQTGNPDWAWYAAAHGETGGLRGDYTWFLRAEDRGAAGAAPRELPSSRLFAGTGQACLNSNLLDGRDNVQVLFKSSPFGSASHGYESQNAFIFSAFGEPLFVKSGTRDIYGSEHHRLWMWETKSVNSITVSGRGQEPHRTASRGRIIEFSAGSAADYVAGECGAAYSGRLDSFTRRILFVKPDLVVIFDTLSSPAAETFEWRLHSNAEMKISGQNVTVEGKTAAARLSMLSPQGLGASLTSAFDPPPRPHVKLVQWHLALSTPAASKSAEFVAAIRPFRPGSQTPPSPGIRRQAGGFALTARVGAGSAVILLRIGEGELGVPGFSSKSRVALRIAGDSGDEIARFESDEVLDEAF